jgi:hypothetical protein
MVYDIPAVYVVQSTEDVTSKFQMVLASRRIYANKGELGCR